MEREKKVPSALMSLTPIVIMAILLLIGSGALNKLIGIEISLKSEPIIIICAVFAGILAYYLGYSWNEMQGAIVEKISKALPATLILWSVGFLIGGLMFSGSVPMIIYYGVQWINPQYIIVLAFLLSALLSVLTGTSWGAAGTIGVAMMGIAGGLDVSLPATAGAVVSGAYFGDKLSPLSDTTNLAPIAAGSELREHIKHMLYTTIPASIFACIIYLIIGLNADVSSYAAPEQMHNMTTQLDEMFNFNILLLLPLLIVVMGSVFKLPTIPIMLISSLLCIPIGIISHGFSVQDGFLSLVSGFNVEMTPLNAEPIFEVTRLINRGGATSVTATTVLVFCAMGFAGIMSVSGMLDTTLSIITKGVKTAGGVIFSTIASCFTVAFVTGSSYLTILIPGELFNDVYPKYNLHAKNLSRTLEDSGTVLVPLIPWSAAGAYMASALGVSTIEYLPWAILNWSGIIIAIILGYTGIGIAKSDGSMLRCLIKKGDNNVSN
ncbi:MAG: Na+/H+ antiporter NhaC [Bacilli bacterium]